MKYLVFKLEHYYPYGGFGDIYAYAKGDQDLQIVIQSMLLDAKENILNKRRYINQDIREYEDDREEVEEKLKTDSSYEKSLEIINRHIKYSIEKLNDTYNIDEISLFFDIQVVSLDGVQIYEIPEHKLKQLLKLDTDKLEVVTAIDLEDLLKEDTLVSDKFDEIFAGKKIIIK